MSRIYTAQPGDSFTFNGETYVADKKGAIKVDDSVPHDEMLSHGFTLAVKQGAAAPAADDQPQA